MAEKVVGANEQSLHHFVCESNWNSDAVKTAIAERTNSLLGGKGAALLIDETSFPKKGKKSVGVSRQYCGQRGKVDNCQVAVYTTLAKGKNSGIVDFQLYLPKLWTDNTNRCNEAEIPVEKQLFKTKPQIAIELISNCKNKGVAFEWIGADGGYGNNPEFVKALNDNGITFIGDIACDTKIFLDNPAPYIHDYTYKNEEQTKLKTKQKSIKVDNWFRLNKDKLQKVEVREGENGVITVNALKKEVWIWDNKTHLKPLKLYLIIRQDLTEPFKTKYSLSNINENVTLEEAVYMQGQRYWVERPFQDGKNTVGMNSYQVRKWKSWNNHMTMVILAMLFMLEVRIENEEDCSLLSCNDIKEILCCILPKKNITEAEVFENIKRRHMNRERAKISKMKKSKSGP